MSNGAYCSVRNEVPHADSIRGRIDKRLVERGIGRALGVDEEDARPSRGLPENAEILLAKSGGADRAAYLAGIGTRSAAEARHVPQADPDRPRARGDGARRPGRLP